MTTPRPPRAFVSYSHSDKASAETISTGLRAAGVDAFFDKWDIQPGDSLTDRIFENGLRDCDVFIVLLSPASINSSWVKSELNAATIHRIEGSTRIIPVVISPCAIPGALLDLMRLDMVALGVNAVVNSIADVAHGRSAKPPLGEPRDRNFPTQVAGLSKDSSAIASMLLEAWREQEGIHYEANTVANFLHLSSQQLDDAADEMEGQGLVKLHRYMGSMPYSFSTIEPTYLLPLFLEREHAPFLVYSPSNDLVKTAAAIVASGALDGSGLMEVVKLPPWRINNAVEWLDDHGTIRVLRALGTSPFDFMHVEATPATRRFASEYAK